MPDSPNTIAPTATESAILGLLARDGELSGYDLRKLVASSVGYFWGPAKSQIYAVLPRLVAQGLVTRRDVAQSRRPDKQVYRITPEGKGALSAWLDEPIEPEPDRSVFLLKLFFGDLASPGALLEQVRRKRAEAEQLRAELNAIDEQVAGSGGELHPALTRRYGQAWADAVIRWARETERELEGKPARRKART